ncbi:MAG TPA: type II secretion system F family protein [Xanthobacteraceae bacterium]
MASFRYRALTASGELTSGTIAAASVEEVARRLEARGLFYVDDGAAPRTTAWWSAFAFINRPTAEDVTVFTRDLALLLKAGARINDALDLLSGDIDLGRLRPVVAGLRDGVLAGESFTEALSRHPLLFPPIYLALARVGEASGTLDHLLEVLAEERSRSEALRRRLIDALRYPAFVLFAAGGVLTFFLFFVLPQFGSVLRDFGAKLDPIVVALLGLSDFATTHATSIAIVLILVIVAAWLALRRPRVRAAILYGVSKLPLARSIMTFHRTALFCRNLSVLLGSGVNLTPTLRILADMMASTGHGSAWERAVDRVRHGAKFSDALADTAALPAMAVRMLRLGDETGQLPMIAARVAEFYEAKLQRSLDRLVGIAGPAAIIVISFVVGGLIVSVMTALLSVSQVVG